MVCFKSSIQTNDPFNPFVIVPGLRLNNFLNRQFSPMPGIVDKILVKEGIKVKAGDPLLVILAMKMEYTIKALSNGIVEIITCEVGENVTKNKVLIKFKDNSNVVNELVKVN